MRTDVELTEEQAQNFTYGEETINSLLFPDWSVINDNWLTGLIAGTSYSPFSNRQEMPVCPDGAAPVRRPSL